MSAHAKIEFGDFQTPAALANEVCALLKRLGIEPDTIIEPTCGAGTFLIAAAEAFPYAQLLGRDVNAHYAAQARAALKTAQAANRSDIQTQNFFSHDWADEVGKTSGSVLVLGNPPWVTNSTVASLNGSNLPVKENFMGLRGIAARTGKANFDISEWMLIQLVRALRGRDAWLAMLCKTATARKLLRFAWQNDGQIAEASIYRIDAKKHFGAAVDACVLLLRTGTNGPSEAAVFSDLGQSKPEVKIGLAGKNLVADVRTYRRLRNFEGLCPYQWRSGVKHDCASVMELWRNGNGKMRNKLDEVVELEPNYLFPLLKCSDLANGRTKPERWLLLTQRRVGDDTSGIAEIAPKTWRYLNRHHALFTARKSSIYHKRADFSVFGIGDYAFAPWKVAVSGLHRQPAFVLLGSHEGKPLLLDDTCYFLSFDNQAEAQIVAKILNSAPCREFLSALVFEDTKRPITVEILQRLNLKAIAGAAGLAEEWETVAERFSRVFSEMEATQGLMLMDAPRKRKR
jgi:hypothetical protein